MSGLALAAAVLYAIGNALIYAIGNALICAGLNARISKMQRELEQRGVL